MGLKISEEFSGTFLTAADLKGRSVPVTIGAVRLHEFDDGKKLIVSFTESDKELVANKTNCRTIAEMHGDDTDTWLGRKIVLVPAMTDFGGKRVPCIRIDPAVEPMVEPDDRHTRTRADGISPDDSNDMPF